MTGHAPRVHHQDMKRSARQQAALDAALAAMPDEPEPAPAPYIRPAKPPGPWLAIIGGMVLLMVGSVMLASDEVAGAVLLVVGGVFAQIGIVAAGVLMAHRLIRWHERV